MTERLYYDDPYLFDFTARVTACRAREDGKYDVYLDRSAFYPTSGGQPYDTGAIGESRVVDVIAEKDGETCHVTDAPVGGEVACRIDRARRIDHMQQHAGEHLLAGELFHMYGGHTIGLHLGHDTSTIDCELEKKPSDAELEEIERRVNRHIQACDQIRQWFPTEEELASVPLRKPPTVKEHIRVVLMGDYEACACGGTHPDNTGKIGAFRLIDAAPARGKIRFTFVCGMRAVAYDRLIARQVADACALLSTGPDSFSAAVSRLQEEVRAGKEKQRALEEALAGYRAKELLEGAAILSDGTRVVAAEAEGNADSLTRLASLLTKEKAIALLESTGEKRDCVFAAPAGDARDMGALMKQATALVSGRGGGKRDFARGAGKGAARAALGLLMERGS